MWKCLLITFGALLAIAVFMAFLATTMGCQNPGQNPQLPFQASEQWTSKYGESEQSEVYYNIAVTVAVLRQHAASIQANTLALTTTQPGTQPSK